SAELAQGILFFGRQARHRLGDLCSMFREYSRNKFAALVGNLYREVATVSRALYAFHHPGFFQVVNDHRQIAARAQYFACEFAQAHGPDMIEGFQYAKLTLRYAMRIKLTHGLRTHRVGRAQEIYV